MFGGRLGACQPLATEFKRINVRRLSPETKDRTYIKPGPFGRGRSLANLRDQSRVIVTAAMNTINSIAAGMNQPICTSHELRPLMALVFTASPQRSFTEGRSVCQALSNAAAGQSGERSFAQSRRGFPLPLLRGSIREGVFRLENAAKRSAPSPTLPRKSGGEGRFGPSPAFTRLP
jgi:hypothetical protein